MRHGHECDRRTAPWIGWRQHEDWDGSTFAAEIAATDDETPIVVDIVIDDPSRVIARYRNSNVLDEFSTFRDAAR